MHNNQITIFVDQARPTAFLQLSQGPNNPRFSGFGGPSQGHLPPPGLAQLSPLDLGPHPGPLRTQKQFTPPVLTSLPSPKHISNLSPSLMSSGKHSMLSVVVVIVILFSRCLSPYHASNVRTQLCPFALFEAKG